MEVVPDRSLDVMQVCRNGHVITDLLRSLPGRALAHCDRCGAPTLDRCPTCGAPLPGATPVPGLVPLGSRAAPERCAACGAAFPWAGAQPPAAPPDPLAALETLLRRLPRAVRQLRTRHGDRPPFRVKDVYDLEDLLRALLPLAFERVHPETRTPAYAPLTRTDFRLGNEGEGLPVALTAKLAGRTADEARIGAEWAEDRAYYGRVRGCEVLFGLVYDPEGLLREPRRLEATWSAPGEEPAFRGVIAS